MNQRGMVRALSRTLTLTLRYTAATSYSTRSFCSSTAAKEATTSSDFAIKNVTRSNFEPVLGDLRRLIREADFVAIDLEMTGVTSAPWRESFEFDRSDIRYLKVKDSAEKFAVVQFGVCPFRWDPSNDSFVAHPHNFYIFPRQEIPADGHSYEFLCQTTSIDFLAKYQFDFNVCIREGISYLSRGQEEAALRDLHLLYENDELAELRSSSREFTDKPLVRIADILFAERIKNRIKEWRDGLLQNRNDQSRSEESSNELGQQFKTIFLKMRPAFLLNGFTTHQLSLIQLVVERHFKELVYVRLKGENTSAQHYVVYADSTCDRNLLMKEVREDIHRNAEMKVKSAIGFRQVIDILSSEQKLIVGHNCFLDIAHIHSKFFGPLPSTAEEYVSSIHKYFPYIIDTKLLLNANDALQHKMKKSSTSLSKAFALLCTEISFKIEGPGLVFKPHVKVEVQVDGMRSSNWNSGAKHEAGYDAFMTGCVFAQACSYLGFDFKLHPPSGKLASDEKLQKHINRLYLSWINGDIIDLTTGRQIAESSLSSSQKYPAPKIVFPNIALVWGLPSKVKAREIKKCFSDVFGPISVTSVYHLDETAVFVQFSKAEFVSDFLELKEILERSNGPISVLHPLSKLLEGGNICAANYEVYKEICSSSLSRVKFVDQASAVGIKWRTELIKCEVDASKQENEDLTRENPLSSVPSSLGKIKGGKTITMVDDQSQVDFPDEDIVESAYAVEAQVRK